MIKTIIPIEPFKLKVETRWFANNTVPRLLMYLLSIIGSEALNQDRQVWENKIYRQKPELVGKDGLFIHFQKWFYQFYSEQ